MIFKRTSGVRLPLSHLIGLALLSLLLPFALAMSPLQLSFAATGTLVLVACWELVSLRESRAALKAA